MFKRYFLSYLLFIYENKDYPNLILYNKDQSEFIYSTGLHTKDGGNEFYAYFVKNTDQNHNKKYYFKGFRTKGSPDLASFTLGNMKSLHNDEEFEREIEFDKKLDFRFNDEHLYDDERRERLPEIIKNLPIRFIRHIIEGEVSDFKKDILNRKAEIVPSIYIQKISFFLPLKLTQQDKVDTILVFQKQKDEQGKEYYAAKTLYNPNDNVYVRARVIAKINTAWVKDILR